MKPLAGMLVVWSLFVLAVSAQQPPAPPAGREPSWAFPAINGAVPAEDPGPKSVAGSAKTYTPAQIDDLLNPPDWFPNEHAPAPSIVQKGHAGALALDGDKVSSAPAAKVNVADTTGAGDAFLAAYCLARAVDSGGDPTSALALANAWAGLAVQVHGTAPPRRADLLNVLEPRQGRS